MISAQKSDASMHMSQSRNSDRSVEKKSRKSAARVNSSIDLDKKKKVTKRLSAITTDINKELPNMSNYYIMGQTTAVISPTKVQQLDQKKMDLDARSEVRPQAHSKKPPIGRVVILPNGVIDERNHD